MYMLLFSNIRTEVKCSSSPESLFVADLKEHDFPLGGALALFVIFVPKKAPLGIRNRNL